MAKRLIDYATLQPLKEISNFSVFITYITMWFDKSNTFLEFLL